jgi:hypothetical protein
MFFVGKLDAQEHLADVYRHLTNYSINKGAENFQENQRVQADNYGHKWSLSALNRHLRCTWATATVGRSFLTLCDIVGMVILFVGLPINGDFPVCYGSYVKLPERKRFWLSEPTGTGTSTAS